MMLSKTTVLLFALNLSSMGGVTAQAACRRVYKGYGEYIEGKSSELVCEERKGGTGDKISYGCPSFVSDMLVELDATMHCVGTFQDDEFAKHTFECTCFKDGIDFTSFIDKTEKLGETTVCEEYNVTDTMINEGMDLTQTSTTSTDSAFSTSPLYFYSRTVGSGHSSTCAYGVSGISNYRAASFAFDETLANGILYEYTFRESFNGEDCADYNDNNGEVEYEDEGMTLSSLDSAAAVVPEDSGVGMVGRRVFIITTTAMLMSVTFILG